MCTKKCPTEHSAGEHLNPEHTSARRKSKDSKGAVVSAMTSIVLFCDSSWFVRQAATSSATWSLETCPPKSVSLGARTTLCVSLNESVGFSMPPGRMIVYAIPDVCNACRIQAVVYQLKLCCDIHVLISNVRSACNAQSRFCKLTSYRVCALSGHLVLQNSVVTRNKFNACKTRARFCIRQWRHINVCLYPTFIVPARL